MNRASAIGPRLDGVEGVGPGEDGERADRGAELGEPALGRLDQAVGVLEGAARGEHQDLVGPAGGQQVAVEVAAAAPLGATDERKRPRHDGQPYRVRVDRGSYRSVRARP